MPRRSAFGLVAVVLAAAFACSSSIQFPGQLVGSFNTALIPTSNTCTQFFNLPGFCSDNGSPGPCTDGGFPDGGTTVLVVSTVGGDAGFVSYQSGTQSATASGTWDGQTVLTSAVAERFFVISPALQPAADAGCIAQVTETIQLSIYASLDGGCDGGIPVGPPPGQIVGVWQTQTSPACGILVDMVQPDTHGACCADPLPDAGPDGTLCGSPVPPACSVSFGLVGTGRSSPP
jgi:hypothetical protein